MPAEEACEDATDTIFVDEVRQRPLGTGGTRVVLPYLVLWAVVGDDNWLCVRKRVRPLLDRFFSCRIGSSVQVPRKSCPLT